MKPATAMNPALSRRAALGGLGGAFLVVAFGGAAGARQRLRRRLVDRPMRATAQRRRLEAGARQHPRRGLDMAHLA